MRRTKRGISPGVDIMESRALLSGAAPFVSHHALSVVVRDVRAIMNTLARTGNTVRAGAQLEKLSSRIPSGPEALAPSWQGDLALYRAHSAGSLLATERLILGDLYLYVAGGDETRNEPAPAISAAAGQGGNATATGSGATTGQGTGGAPTPAPAPSLDSVTIRNTTGLAITVTVRLDVPQVQQPWITETIPAQGNTTVPFNFGTATDAFMTMNVSMANGSQTPPPLTDLSLSQPLGGYDGALFSISLVGPYFNVTPL